MTARQSHWISTADFAEWLQRQGAGVWWTADGDPFLTRRLALPAPSTRIAEFLRSVPTNQHLNLLQELKRPPGQVHVQDVDDYTQQDRTGARVLRLSWDNSPMAEWLLIEDQDAAQIEAG